MSAYPNQSRRNGQEGNDKTKSVDALKVRKQKGARIVIWAALTTVLAVVLLVLMY